MKMEKLIEFSIIDVQNWAHTKSIFTSFVLFPSNSCIHLTLFDELSIIVIFFSLSIFFCLINTYQLEHFQQFHLNNFADKIVANDCLRHGW